MKYIIIQRMLNGLGFNNEIYKMLLPIYNLNTRMADLFENRLYRLQTLGLITKEKQHAVKIVLSLLKIKITSII